MQNNDLSTMTENEKDFLDLFSKADDEGKLFIANLLMCFVSGGDAFFKEFEAIPPQDRDGARACVNKWILIIGQKAQEH